jgi:glyoxylase-like metal-dependent hydrolase (beta-lactamase superfamily II)
MSKAMERRGGVGPDVPVGDRRFWVGSIECRIVSDGTGLCARDQIATGVAEEDLVPLIGDRAEENGMIRRPYNCLLVRSSDRLALIDAGLGRLAVATGVPAGRMQGSLREMGLAPSDIDAVLISHAHPAHIGGLTREGSEGRAPTFGTSCHWFWRAEWEFWTSEERLAELPERLAGPARLHLPVLQRAGLVQTAEEETEVLPGVRLLPAPGHTPGHMAVAITSGRHGAIYVGDAVPHELSLDHPEWVPATDLLPELAVRTRKALIDRARRERRLIVASHLASPLRLRPPRTRAGRRENGDG